MEGLGKLSGESTKYSTEVLALGGGCNGMGKETRGGRFLHDK